MGLIRKSVSFGLTGGLVGFRSKEEKAGRHIARNAEATARNTAAIAHNTLRNTALQSRQLELMERHAPAIASPRTPPAAILAPPPTMPAQLTAPERYELLIRAADLHAAGIISDDELATMKAELMPRG